MKNLENIRDIRLTRTIIGKPSSMDMSDIFENEIKDFLTGEFITHENFDNDYVIFIKDMGYTRRNSLLELNIQYINIDDIHKEITPELLLKGK